MLQVKDFISTSITYYNFLLTSDLGLSSSFAVISYCFYPFIRVQSFCRCSRRDGPLKTLWGGGGEVQSTYTRKGKLNEKQKSCTPITPKKYSCYGLNKIHQKFPTPLPHNFSNGPSLNFTVIFLTVTSKSVCFTHETPLISLKSQFFATCVDLSCLLPLFVFYFY